MLAWAVVLGIVGCAPLNGNHSLESREEVSVGRTTFSFDDKEGYFGNLPHYQIKSGDVLDVLFQIQTWTRKDSFTIAIDNTILVKFDRAPELNEEQRIRPDGTISLPYIGSIFVLGKTVTGLEQELVGRYEKVLRNPQIHVVISDFGSSIKELKADLHTTTHGLSRFVTVRSDGVATFPMLGEIVVAGRTITDVRDELNQKYDKVFPDLRCDLFLDKPGDSQIYIVGEIRRPGAYSVTKPISVVQAIALAGSTTSDAEMHSVMVVRKKDRELVATRVDLRASLDFTTKTPFFYLQPDDIVIVPRTRLSESAQISGYIADIVLFRGWSVQYDRTVQISK